MIIVKSIKEKPKECRGGRLLDEVTYDCVINSESIEYTTLEEQYKHCPIKDVPNINVGNMDTITHDSIPVETGKNDGDRTSGDCISRQAATDALETVKTVKAENGELYIAKINAQMKLEILPSVQPERKAVFNRDIAIEAICDEVMLWFDISATKAYEIADTAVKRIEVRMEKMERGES